MRGTVHDRLDATHDVLVDRMKIHEPGERRELHVVFLVGEQCEKERAEFVKRARRAVGSLARNQAAKCSAAP